MVPQIVCETVGDDNSPGTRLMPPTARAREAARTQRLNLPKGVLLSKGFDLAGTPYYAITHSALGEPA